LMVCSHEIFFPHTKYWGSWNFSISLHLCLSPMYWFSFITTLPGLPLIGYCRYSK
jgi:hypothetical protein